MSNNRDLSHTDNHLSVARFAKLAREQWKRSLCLSTVFACYAIGSGTALSQVLPPPLTGTSAENNLPELPSLPAPASLLPLPAPSSNSGLPPVSSPTLENLPIGESALNLPSTSVKGLASELPSRPDIVFEEVLPAPVGTVPNQAVQQAPAHKPGVSAKPGVSGSSARTAQAPTASQTKPVEQDNQVGEGRSRFTKPTSINNSPGHSIKDGVGQFGLGNPTDAGLSGANVEGIEGLNGIIRLEPLPGSLECPVITAMAVSKDGTFIAAAGDDHAIRLISLADRKTQSVWTGHLDWIRDLAFTEDGDRLASCANDGFIRVWDTQTLQAISSSQIPHALDALTFVDDETIFAVGFGPNVYRVNANSGETSVDHTCDCGDLRTITVSPNREYLAYAGRDGVLRVQKFASKEDYVSPTEAWSASPIHFSRIRSLHFSEDSLTITSVGEDRKVVHFDVEERSIISQTTVRGGKLMGLIPLSADEFAVAGADNTIRIVGWNDATPQTKLVGHDGSVCVLQKTNRFLISAGFDTTIRIWDLERARLERDTEGRYMHPVAAQFEDSGASSIEAYVSAPVD